MNITQKKYAIKRIEEICSSLRSDYFNKKNIFDSNYLNREEIEEAFLNGKIRFPKEKEFSLYFNKVREQGINYIFVGIEKIQKEKKDKIKKVKEDIDRYNLKLKEEKDKIVDEIMLGNDCNISEMISRLNNIK